MQIRSNYLIKWHKVILKVCLKCLSLNGKNTYSSPQHCFGCSGTNILIRYFKLDIAYQRNIV